jgi:hypothetical protein
LSEGGTLTEAIISGNYIYCPIRALKIDLEDGRVQAPDKGQAQTFLIHLEKGVVHMGIPKDNDKLVSCEQCGKHTGVGPMGKSWVCEDCKVTPDLPKRHVLERTAEKLQDGYGNQSEAKMLNDR